MPDRWKFFATIVALSVSAPFFSPPENTEPRWPAAHIDPDRLGAAFNDQFTTFSLYDNAARWGTWKTNYAFGAQSGRRAIDSRTLPANAELQVYVDPGLSGTGVRPLGLDPFSVSGGLVIHAGPTPPALVRTLWGRRYVSGLLTTETSFSQTYGYFAIRAALPRRAGVWPAFWLLPVDGKGAAEIDVFESIGADTVYQSVHGGPNGRATETQFETRVADVARPHDYGVLWTATTIAFYIDGRRTAVTPTPPDLVGRPMYMLIDLAVGGRWPGPPRPGFRGADLRVQSVRVWVTTPGGGFRRGSTR